MRWLALFSQTGSEITQLSDKLGYKPDHILTNNISYNGPLNAMKYTHKHLVEWLKVFCTKKDVITLHGYLRILPEDICHLKIFNGHPGLITKYPELKGKDPQKKALQLNLSETGVIIHRVDKDVDTGPIILSKTYFMRGDETEEILINRLREYSIDLWKNFFVWEGYNNDAT